MSIYVAQPSPVLALSDLSPDVFVEILSHLDQISTLSTRGETPNLLSPPASPPHQQCVKPAAKPKVAKVKEALPTTNITSLMVRNVPVRLSQREALTAFLENFDKDKVDYFYAPSDISKKDKLSLGFCFINLTTVQAAADFRRRFAGKPLVAGGFPLTVSTAAVQGLARNIETMRLNPTMRRIKNPEYLPLTRNAHGRFVAISTLPLLQ